MLELFFSVGRTVCSYNWKQLFEGRKVNSIFLRFSEGFAAFRVLLHYLKIRDFANHSGLRINMGCLNLKNHPTIYLLLEPFWTSVKEVV